MSLATRVRVPIKVTIGEGRVGQSPEVMQAMLGSCLGVVIGWPARGRYGLVHVLLPTPKRDPNDPRLYRFAQTAPAHLVAEMGVPPQRIHELRAVVAGGGDLYPGASSSAQVGASNVVVGRRALRALGIQVVALEVGGSDARALSVDCRTGVVTLRRFSRPGPAVEQQWRLG